MVPSETSTLSEVQAICQNALSAANLTKEVDFDVTEVTGYILIYT